jgi:CelD/BcsL family acetyltransferase involved in cellulose biosynthesis
MLDVEPVTTVTALERIETEWSELWQLAATATPFQAPAWLLPWWRHFGRGELWTLAVRANGRLVGLAPLFIDSQETDGTRLVRFVGTGISDYLDVLLDPAFAEEVSDAVLHHLAGFNGWDAADLEELPERSVWAGVLGRAGASRAPESDCPVVRLPRSKNEYLDVLSPNRRRKLGYARRLLEAGGRVVVERAGERTLPEFVDQLFELHQARWQERRQAGVLADPAVQAFHREAAERLGRSGHLRLLRLRQGTRVCAVLYLLADKHRWYYYLGGFSPELRQASPGSVLIAGAIEAAIGEGCSAFDFLRGREPYKYAWGAADEHTCRAYLKARALEGVA